MVDARALTKLGSGALRILDDMGFYSKGAEVARGLQRKSGSPEAMLNDLTKGGVKKSEIENADFMGETKGIGKLSRDDAADLFEAKKPKLFENDLGHHDDAVADPQFADPKYNMPNGSYYNERLIQNLEPPSSQDYVGSHWMEPNVIAHLRMNERTLPGGRHATHLEEIQSDWAQDGRKRGIQSGDDLEAQYRALVERSKDQGLSEDDYEKTLERLRDVSGRMSEDRDAVPRGPFITNNDWVDLGLKRALTIAAEKENPYVTLAPGEAQLRRWGGGKNAAGVQRFYDGTVQPKLTRMLGQPEMIPLPDRRPTMADINRGDLDGPMAQVPAYRFPEETQELIKRNGWPIFADGGIVDGYAAGGPVEDLDVPSNHARLAGDSELVDMLMNQQSMRANGQLPPVDWAGDLSGVDRRKLVPPRPQPVRKADGGEITEQQPLDLDNLTEEQVKAALAYLTKMQKQQQDD